MNFSDPKVCRNRSCCSSVDVETDILQILDLEPEIKSVKDKSTDAYIPKLLSLRSFRDLSRLSLVHLYKKREELFYLLASRSKQLPDYYLPLFLSTWSDQIKFNKNGKCDLKSRPDFNKKLTISHFKNMVNIFLDFNLVEMEDQTEALFLCLNPNLEGDILPLLVESGAPIEGNYKGTPLIEIAYERQCYKAYRILLPRRRKIYF